MKIILEWREPLEFFKRIKTLLKEKYYNAKILELAPRSNRPNSSATVILDITDLYFLKNNIIPLFSSVNDTYLFKTKKLNDFKD